MSVVMPLCLAFLKTASLQSLDSERTAMNPITIQNTDEILALLADVALHGPGFSTDCLLDYVLEEGFTEPIFLNEIGRAHV